MKNDLIKKINAVIDSINLRIENLEKSIKEASLIFDQFEDSKENNIKKYQYELEKYNYRVLKNKNEMTRSQLFIKRCLIYINYLNSLEENNLFSIKKNEYEFIKNIQEETIMFYDSKIEELKIKRLIENICEVESKSILKIEELKQKKEKVLNKFLNGNFNFDEDKIYTIEYLDYDIEEVVNKIYKRQSKKKAS